MSGDSHRDDRGPPRPGGDQPSEDELLDAVVKVSRAHWLITATLSWLPEKVRRHAEDATELLEQVIRDLRRQAFRRRRP
ncbi:hypothetical protein [Nocardioides koreensis]